MSLRQVPALYLADTLSACPRPSGRGLPPDAPAGARQLEYGKVALFLLIVSVADAPERPSVTRRCSAASAEKSMLKYQTIESYAPLAAMSGANCVLTAGLIPLRKISEPVAGDQFGDVSKLFSQSRSAFARFAVRPNRLIPGDHNDM